ncbi:MAG: lysophospholipid acyltransferase family protein [Pseudomonadota bacterium]
MDGSNAASQPTPPSRSTVTKPTQAAPGRSASPGAPPPNPSPKRPRDRNQGLEPQPLLNEWLEWLGLCLARLILAPLGPTGRSRFLGWCGRHIGARLWLVRRIDRNIDLVRPDYDAVTRQRVRRGVMENFARTAIEYMDLPHLRSRAGSFEVRGIENWRAAHAAAGGKMVVVSAHYGNWEAVRAVADLQGAPLGIIYRAFNNRRMDDYSYGLITACGWPAWRKGAEGSKALFKHLRGGGAALILVDQRLGGAPGLDVMGQPAVTSLAAAHLALRLKAPLLPAAAKRVGDGFEVTFEPPIEPTDPLEMSERVNAVVGAWVDAAPDQWFWLHRRWRRRDDGGVPSERKRTYGRQTTGDGGDASGPN